MKSFKLEVIADDSGEWASNDFHFATVGEAAAYGENLRSRWTLVRQTRVVQCSQDHPVNAVWNDEKAALVKDRVPRIIEVVEVPEPLSGVMRALSDLHAFIEGDLESMSEHALKAMFELINRDEMREDAIRQNDEESWRRTVETVKAELERRGIKVKT